MRLHETVVSQFYVAMGKEHHNNSSEIYCSKNICISPRLRISQSMHVLFQFF